MNYKVMGACLAVFLSVKAQVIAAGHEDGFEANINPFCGTPPDAGTMQELLLSNIRLQSTHHSDASLTTERVLISFGELSEDDWKGLSSLLCTKDMEPFKKQIIMDDLAKLSKSDLETVLTECEALPLKDFEIISRIIGKYIGNN